MAANSSGKVRQKGQVEELAGRIAGMDRPELISLLRGMECSFDLDFTDEFLDGISLERLRHIILGAALHVRHSTA